MMGRPAACLALSLLALLALAPAARQAVPPAAELAKAGRDVRATFKDEYAKAKRSPADREALGRKLLEQAPQNENEPALKYVLLREARDLAASVGDTKTITAAADKMAEAYDISRPAALLPGFQAALKGALPPAAANDIAETCLTIGDDAIAADDYDTAARCVAVAEQSARLARDAGLSSRVAERVASIRALRTGHQRAVAALQKLKADHNNPSLNLVAGKFYCLDKGDWESGLPFLARGSDPELKDLAALDLKGAPKPADQAALGDRYWQAAAHAGGPAKPALQNRARYWYGKALPSMDGLEKVRLRERLDTDPVWKLHDMIKPDDASVRPTPEGVETTGHGRIDAPTEFRVPVRIDATAKTESTNIRLFFGEKGVLIFNWEVNPQELRFHAPDSGGINAVANQGHVPPNTWVHITWLIEPTGSTVLVDGKPRAVFHGNYAGLSGKAGIGGTDAKLSIRQFDVMPLSRK